VLSSSNKFRYLLRRLNHNNEHIDTSRIRWLERNGGDFPYYNDRPVGLSARQWILVIVGVAVGFYVLTRGYGNAIPTLKGFVPAISYVAIPLIILAIVTKGHWTALFRKIRGRDIWLMIGFAILNVIVTMMSGFLFIDLDTATTNATVAGLADQGGGELVLSYLRAAIQLVGEEIMTILPFLALIWLFAQKMKTGRVTAIVLAWLITAVLFAAEHLPTYGWNFVQALTGVGVARLVLTLPYIMTKNLWVSAGAHILNDWIMFSLSLLLAGAAAETQ
jgi:membrane protease YdiL (CAAX protease family)